MTFSRKNILIKSCTHDFHFKFVSAFHLNCVCVCVSKHNVNIEFIRKFKIMKELSLNYFIETKLFWYVLI